MVHENRTEEYMQMGKEACSQARHQAEEAFHATQDVVRENPLSATLAVFSVGVGLGLLATCMLMPRKREWYESMGDRSYRQIADTIARMVPESIRAKLA
jgi:hypothetical protein